MYSYILRKGSMDLNNPDHPLVSVVIPYFNAQETLGRTLQSILQSSYDHYQIITVDDASTDDSSDHVIDVPGIHLCLRSRSGAAIARNIGVAAGSGDILFFVDADVTIQPDTLGEVVRTFREHPDISACFGEYTPMPRGRNFPTVYKNLVHHFTHQHANQNAQTFWCGCGAVLRDSFVKVGGFDESFVAASVEDIDLGYRLHGQGCKILLNKKLQVTHGKHYSFAGLIKSDFFSRAIPWTKLMVSRNIFVPDLNLKWNNILSALVLIFGLPLLFAAGWITDWHHYFWIVPAPAVLIAYVFLNVKILLFVARQKGFFFSLAFLAMYTLTYAYSVIGFAIGVLAYLRDRFAGKEKTR